MKSSFLLSEDNFPRSTLHSIIRIAAVLVFVCTLPFGWRVFQPVNNIAIMVLGVNWLFESSPRYKINLLKNSNLFFFITCYFLVYAAGLLYSSNIHAGLFVLEKKLPLIVFPLVFLLGKPLNFSQLKLILSLFVYSCVAATLICFAKAVIINNSEGYTFNYVYDSLVHGVHEEGRYTYFNYWYFTNKLFAAPIGMHPVYFAMYLVFSGCAAIYLWWKNSSAAVKFFLCSLLALNLLSIILLSSRTQLFCAVTFLSFFVILYSSRKKRVVLPVVSLLIIFAAGVAMIWYNPILRERIIESNVPGTHFSANKYGEGGLSLRLFKWKYTLAAIGENPLLGYGTGDGQNALQKIYADNNFEIGLENRFNPHNQYLQSALDVGIAGIVSFLLLLYLPLKKGISMHNVLLILLAILFSISCVTESMLEVNKGVIFYSFFCALLINAGITPEENSVSFSEERAPDLL